MAEDGGEESAVSTELPSETAAWLAERADEQDLTEAAYLRRLLLAHQRAADGNVEAPTRESVAELEGRVGDLEEDVTEKISDVRERVVQVKREADTKASADHDHPEFDERLRVAAATAEATQSELADLEDRVEALEETTERGFDNYEEVLEYLTETTEDIEEKMTRVATALVHTRRVLGDIAAAEEERHGLAGVLKTANQRGIAAADCGECDRTVDLGLLTEPACPHCETPVHGVEPKSGFFGSPSLLTGEPPALESGVAEVAHAEEGVTDAEVDTEDAVTALLEEESLADLGAGEATEAATDGNGTGDESDGETGARTDG
jgi:hypothetical protein